MTDDQIPTTDTPSQWYDGVSVVGIWSSVIGVSGKPVAQAEHLVEAKNPFDLGKGHHLLPAQVGPPPAEQRPDQSPDGGGRRGPPAASGPSPRRRRPACPRSARSAWD